MSEIAARTTSSLASAIDFPVLEDLANGIAARAQNRAFRAVRLQFGLAVFLSLLGDASGLFPVIADWLRRGRNTLEDATGWAWLDLLKSNYLPEYILIPHGELWCVAVLTAAAILLSLMYVHRDAEQHRLWFEARAGAESVKTATWRLMMCTHPFHTPASVATFPDVLQRILERNALLGGVMSTSGSNVLEPTRTNLDVRTLADWRDRREVYRIGRLEDQIQWYSRGAVGNRMQAKRYRSWVSLIWGAAIGLACLRALAASLWDVDVNFVATIGALAAAMVGWTEAKRFEELATSYAAAGRELVEIRTVLTAAQDDESFERAVIQSEQAISREHTMWVAKSNLPGLLPESLDQI